LIKILREIRDNNRIPLSLMCNMWAIPLDWLHPPY